MIRPRWLLAWTLLAAAPVAAQDPDVLGAALAAACGPDLDPRVHAVLAGTVTDSVSGVPLPGVLVSVRWRAEGDTADTAMETMTDAAGFYGFCTLPDGATVTLVATLHVRSHPVHVETEAGQLHVEPIILRFSDPDSKGVLAGRIVDPQARQPVADAVVHLVELGRSTTTNSRGYFTFNEQAWGVYTLAVNRLGYAPLSAPVRVAGNLTQVVEIEMTPDALKLEGITVSVRSRDMGRNIDGLVRRMNAGFGQYITRETIERRPGARVADLLQEVPGVWVRRGQFGVPILEVRGRRCVPDVFVDGIVYHLDPDSGLDFHSGELEAVEVYRGVSTPGEFRRPGRVSSPCAVIVVWTRRGY